MESDNWQREHRRRRDRRRTIAAVSLGASVSIAAQNADLLVDACYLLQDNHEVPAVSGCEVANPGFVSPEESERPEDQDDKVLSEVADNISAARSFPISPASGGSFESRELHPGYFDTKVGEFYQPLSGITFDIYSDEAGGFRVNEKALQEVTTTALENWELYEHQAVREVMECLYEDVILNKKLAGERVDLYIPSQPDICMRGLYMVKLNALQTKDDCHTRGFTMPPDIILRAGPFILTIEDKGYVVVSGGGNDPEQAEQDVSKMLLHEMIHEYLRLLDVQQLIDPEERFADYVTLTAKLNQLYQDLAAVDYVK